MEYILYISRFLYRIRWWLLLGTGIITILVYLLTSNLSKNYNVKSTVYTGVISGYSLEENTAKTDWASAQNAIDNLINIIQAESTLQRVSMRLYARTLINGNPDQDNAFVTAAHYRHTYNHLKNSAHGKEIIALIDKSSEDKTVENFFKYQQPDKHNYLYGLFYYSHPHYSYGALRNIRVSRKGASDLLEISYAANDPGITYNTISILMEEFVNEYRTIRYGETDKVIAYFKSELERIGDSLRIQEDNLTDYNVEKRIINYSDETKEIAAISKEFELREQNALIAYNSAKVMLSELEKQMDINAKQLVNNMQFVNKLKEASVLTGKISEIETISNNEDTPKNSMQSYKQQLSQARQELSDITDQYVSHQYSKEGIARSSIVEQWLDQTLQFEKAKSDLLIAQKSRSDLDTKYQFFAPVGSTIKRKERSITFVEQNYLSILKSYNDALMRRKNLEMTSTTIKVLNPPAFPIWAEPTGRKKMTMAACVGSFLFILGFFLLLELLDRTLRDPLRAHRLTGLPLLGAFPANSVLRFRKYNKLCSDIAIKHLSNSTLRFLTDREEGGRYIVNFISTESGEGKSFLIEQLSDYWKSIGLKVRKLSYSSDFDTNSRQYLLAKKATDLYIPGDEDILIVEYPSLKESNIPEGLLQEANVNIFVSQANRGWKETDSILVEKLKKQVGTTSLCLYLNHASREVVQGYTGMLPPYTFIRRQIYRLSQLALTEKISSRCSPKITDDDDQE